MSIESPTQPAPSFERSAQPPVPSSPTQLMSSSMVFTAADTQAATSATLASTSVSAPEIHAQQQPDDDVVTSSLSLDLAAALSPGGATSDAPDAATTTSTEPDPQILEALRSKDRIYVLKLGEMMEGLINGRGVRIELNPTTTYQRLLVYRCSTYYKLTPESDSVTKNLYVYSRSESRIPPRRISELVPPEESSQPAIKIMRRNAQDGLRGRHTSQGGSVAGEDADLSESEIGSIGGRSNATAAGKRFKTLEEREAAYNEARSRIFMDFEEKEKQKEKDMSANSSTFSLTSGSASTSAGREGSVCDLDDSVSSVPTESERSGPVTRERWDGRRSGGSSSRSRNSYNNGSTGSRNSRAQSPSFTYPGTYDTPHDPSQYMHQAPPPGYIAQYYYPYPPAPGQPHAQPYLAPYSYYQPYGYMPPPMQPHHSDPGTPASDPMYGQQPPPQGHYPNPYMWGPAPPTHSSQMQSQMPPQSPPTMPAGGPMPPPPNQSVPPQNYPYPYTYPMPGYAQPYQQGMMPPPPPPHMSGGMYPPQEFASPPPMMHTNSSGAGSEAGSNNHSRASSRSSGHGGNKRGTPSRRNPWNYGQGPGNGGYTYNVPNMSGGMGGNDVVGPRLSSRRISTGSTSSGIRTPGDEASSTASSTSSSSRHTFTSTSTTSKHPLPARPDWAVGLKPQPVLSSRHHDHGGASSRGSPRIAAPPPLHPTDFPPLSASAHERRTPVPLGGAWTNTSATRSILSSQPGAPHSALVHYPNAQPGANGNGNGAEGEFERPPPKGNAELFNPKGGKKVEKDGNNGEGALAEYMGTMTLEEKNGGAQVGDGELNLAPAPVAVEGASAA